MKELLQSLGDVLKAKKGSEDAIINTRFLEKVNATEVVFKNVLLTESVEEDIFIDYINSDIKRRAQTIGTAYRIAIQYYIAYMNKDLKLIDKITEGLRYFSIPSFLDDIYAEYEHIITTHKIALFYAEELGDIRWLDMSVEQVKDIIANMSVTFAWIETYYKTGFMPQDLSVIDKNSEVHRKLTEEVKLLLDSSDILLDFIKEVGGDIQFKKEVFSENYSLAGSFPIVVGDIVIGVKTGGKIPNTPAAIKKDVSYFIGLRTLDLNPNDTHEPSGINRYMIYYPRFKKIVEVDFIEQE